MRGKVFRNIACLVTNAGITKKNGIQPEEPDLGLFSNAALAWLPGAGVAWVGPDKELPRAFRGKTWAHIRCKGLTAYPGLVDPHTHLVFAGDRSREFSLRMRGSSYQEIAAAGGGIVSTVKETRAASRSKLTRLVEKRLRESHLFGVRLLEAKSGYGLSLDAELNCLDAIRSGAKKFKKIEVVSTCLAAHAIPPEFQGRSREYVDLVCLSILPAVKKKKLARFVDVFCDPGFFSVEETEKILLAAKALSFDLRVHGEELAETGVAEVAAKMGAYSVDHLLKVSARGIRALAESGTIGILLPGTSFYLREAPAPARRLIDAGVAIALATDFNPGTSPTQNLPLIGTIAAVQLGMTTAEIIAALTWNGARSLGEETRYGALLPGYLGEPVFCEGDHPSALFYRMAPSALVFPGES